MIKQLKTAVLQANLDLVKHHLVVLTWGNASAIDRSTGRVVIKPSGVPYERMREADLVVTDLDGRVVEGTLRPSSDLPSHLALYRAWPGIGGVVHTHSAHATCFAQARKPIPCFGTTHADHFHGDIPLTRDLTADETRQAYEQFTGEAIVERLGATDPLHLPAALVAGHGPFAWGATVAEAVETAVTLEAVAAMAVTTLLLNPSAGPLAPHVAEKHFSRKHGPHATYGQG